MLPSNTLDENLEIVEEIETSKTYKILIDGNNGYIDGIESLKQFIYKLLNTEKYNYPIYSFNYGIELENLLGKDYDYIKIELKRRIEECLLDDERINSVNDFKFTRNLDSLRVESNVESIYGNTSIRKEVNI